MVDTIRSADGTTIAYDRSGSGAPLVLVVGAFCDRMTTRELAAHLEPHFTVFQYDRRGRGASGDTAPFAPERELDDLDAVVAAAGGDAFVFGHSSGAVLALEAAARGGVIRAVSAYEPPWLVDDTREPPPPDLVEQVAACIAAGDRAGAATRFLREAVQVPEPVIALMQQGDDWPGLCAIAPTLVYDLAVVGRGMAMPADRLAQIAVPVLVADGEESPAWARNTVAAVTAAIPGARRVSLAGQTHGAAPAVVAPMLVEFFASVA